MAVETYARDVIIAGLLRRGHPRRRRKAEAAETKWISGMRLVITFFCFLLTDFICFQIYNLMIFFAQRFLNYRFFALSFFPTFLKISMNLFFLFQRTAPRPPKREPAAHQPNGLINGSKSMGGPLGQSPPYCQSAESSARSVHGIMTPPHSDGASNCSNTPSPLGQHHGK
jgi:hypothetical protein